MNREEWLKARMAGIGGSEMAAILGVSPWEGPADVWARKKGLTPEREDSLRFRMGRRYEGPVAEEYAEREGVKLLKVDGLYTHPSAPLVGTPDRLIAGKKKGVEIKTADPNIAWTWGEDGTDEIPLYYTTQVATYMALLGYDDWDVAVLFGFNDFRIYRLHRDLELEAMILERAREFWSTYVVGDKEPPPDDSNSYANYLVKKYPSNLHPMIEANDEQTAAIAKLIEVRADLAQVEKQEKLLENMVKGEIGAAEGISSPFGRVTWKLTKDSTTVDWEGIARYSWNLHNDIYTPEVQERYIKEFSTTKPGYRRFLVSPSKLPMKGGE